MGTPQQTAMKDPKKNGDTVAKPPPPTPAPPVAQPQALTPPPAASATMTIAKSGEVVRVGFDTLEGFQALQRIAQAFATSTLVPEAYQKNVANCLIAIEMAARMKASPLMVMQNLYLIHGRPSWSSQYLIASFNDCGRFSAIKYRWTGERNKPTWGCIAWAREKETGEIVEGPEVTMAMAKSEGWIDKKGSKWLTIPQLMLTYRSATFLVRTTAPELTMGLRTADEQEDLGREPSPYDAPTPVGTEGLKALVAAKIIEQSKPAEPAATVEAQAEQEPAHDPVTGEVHEGEPPAGESERIDPTAPAPAEAK